MWAFSPNVSLIFTIFLIQASNYSFCLQLVTVLDKIELNYKKKHIT